MILRERLNVIFTAPPPKLKPEILSMIGAAVLLIGSASFVHGGDNVNTFDIMTKEGAKAYLEIILQKPLFDYDYMDVHGRFPQVSFTLLDNQAGFYEDGTHQCVIKVTVAINRGHGFQTGPIEGIASFNPDGKDFALDIWTPNKVRFVRYVTKEMRERPTVWP
jgi:hypothetical protein